MYYAVHRSNDFLEHHGILGMHWGRRNGPPYPIGSGGHSKSEEKAGWKKSLGGGRNESLYGRKTSSTTKGSAQNKPDAKEKREFKGLTDKQKLYIKRGLIAAGIATAVIGGVYLAKSGKLDPLIERGRQAVLKATGFDAESGLKISKDNANIKEMINKVNQGGFGKELGRSMNCGNCSIAFEAQMRGMDVMANENLEGIKIFQMGRFFNGLRSDSFTEFGPLDVPNHNLAFKTKYGADALRIRGEQVQNLISNKLIQSYPDGARGNIFVTKENFNHWINWERVGDKIQFYDAQNPSANITEMFGRYQYQKNGLPTTAIRLDDLEFNNSNIRSVVSNINTSKADKLVNKFVLSKPETFSDNIIKGTNFVSKYSENPVTIQELINARKKRSLF